MTRPRTSFGAALHGAVALVLVAVAALVAPSGTPAAAQLGDPFPAPLVALLNTGDAEPPVELDLRSLQTIDRSDPALPTFRVAFGGPFTAPGEGYRVSVLVGDPQGARQRTSYLTEGSVVQQSADGETWDDIGTATASFDPVGQVELSVPVGDAPDGAQVWVEARNGDDVRTSGFVPLALLMGEVEVGGMPGARLGAYTDLAGAFTTETADLGPAPVLSVVNQGLTVNYPAAPPTEIDGQPVTTVIDSVRIAPGFGDGRPVLHSIDIDRTAQTVTLMDASVVPAEPVTIPAESWFLSQGFPSAGSGALLFDFGVVTRELEIPLLGDTVAVGLVRTVVLADGRTVSTNAVLGTLDWFAEAGLDASATTTTAAPVTGETVVTPAAEVADDDDEATRTAILIGGAVVCAVFLVAGLALILSARRKRHGRTLLGDEFEGELVDWTAEIEAVRVEEPPVPLPPARRPTGSTPVAAPPDPAPDAPAAPPAPPGLAKAEPVASPPADPAPDTPPPAGGPEMRAPDPDVVELAFDTDDAVRVAASPIAAPDDAPPDESSRARRKRRERMTADVEASDDGATTRGDAPEAAAPPPPKPPPPMPSPSPAGSADPLAFLDAQIGELSTRLDRLGDGS